MNVSHSTAGFGLLNYLDYLTPDERKQVALAFSFANKAHSGQYRVSGEPYITHPVSVSIILASLKQDAVSIMAGLLHDVVEDTAVTSEEIETHFGKGVAQIVEGVTKFSNVQYSSPLKRESENYRKMFISMSKDIRVIIVKLADRLHNMRTIQVMPAQKRKRLAHETLEIYAPIAKRLGMQMISIELEELGFAALYPLRYMILLSHMYRVSAGQAEVLAHLERGIRLKAHEVGLDILDVSTREKQLYGIYRKMSKRKSFNDLLDVYALRVCVKDIKSCYAMLGILHGMYMPKPKSFKDYVAAPKRNGYQSLHTVLYGPHGTPIEIQIRTKEMHIMATQGIASHWLYKTGQSEFNCKKHQAWFNQLAEAKSTCSTDANFIDLIKHTVYESELYVLTPKGKIIELKNGSTVLDFAYSIHTDVGHHASSAIVDREEVPINTVLENGQTVEIVTSEGVIPKTEWLDFVKTSRAKTNIKVFLKEQVLSSQDSLGYKILSYAFEKKGMGYLVNRQVLDDLLEHAGMQTHDVYAKLGRGEIDPEAVIDSCQVEYFCHVVQTGVKPIVIEAKPGVEKFASCCCPIPGDEIVAMMLPNDGLTVHRKNCRAIDLLQHHPLSAKWGDVGQSEFTTICKIEVKPSSRAIFNCLSILSEMKINVLGFQAELGNAKSAYKITLQIRSQKHLEVTLKSLNQLKVVEKVKREIR